MPTITNAQLAITTDRPQDRATVVVSCDIEFTEVEVNAMDLLGLQYSLHCQVLNKDLFGEDPVLSYHHRKFPRVPGEARRHEHVVFDTIVPMYTLNERLFGKDKLVAQLKLKNDETHEEVVRRTDAIAVDVSV